MKKRQSIKLKLSPQEQARLEDWYIHAANDGKRTHGLITSIRYNQREFQVVMISRFEFLVIYWICRLFGISNGFHRIGGIQGR